MTRELDLDSRTFLAGTGDGFPECCLTMHVQGI